MVEHFSGMYKILASTPSTHMCTFEQAQVHT